MTELFETFDDDGRPTGLVERHIVHRDGLWHRAAHVFLFTAEGAMYVQQRSPNKDLYANLLDYSVGEHCKPGESFGDAAIRGLHEELGIAPLTLTPLGGVQRSEYTNDVFRLRDRELHQAFRAVYDGPLRPDPVEVSSVKVLTHAELQQLIAQEPSRLTPSFLRDLIAFSLLDSSPAVPNAHG